MPVHAAREHVATEAPARGDDDDCGHPATGTALLDREAHAPAITSEWAASFTVCTASTTQILCVRATCPAQDLHHCRTYEALGPTDKTGGRAPI